MKKLKLSIGITVIVFTICNCAGHTDYTAPTPPDNVQNTRIVNMGKDEVWSKIVPSLAKNFFVINNIDKESGLINISYSGDPERYIDCGVISSFVQNARGKRTHTFQAAIAQKNYEVMENGVFSNVKREMHLDGRMNIIIEQIETEKSMVTVTTKYVVTKKIAVYMAGRSAPANYSDTISFNTGGSATFPQGTVCCSTGDLESVILELIDQ